MTIKTTDDRPLSIDRYIKLVVDKELEKDDVKTWYNCVKKHAPSGVLKTIHMVDKKGKPHSVSLVHRSGSDDHSYLIPLTRDLSEDEVERIVKAFAEKMPAMDFDIETHEKKLLAKDHDGISLDAAKHVALCTALAKQKHEDWVRERSGAGWRYGPKFDADEKTHPLLRPWDQIPERYREPDLDWPQKLVSLLNDQGYAIIQRDELDRLLNLMRSVV